VRLHGKLCMQECDIRTFLTRPLYEAAPEYDPGKNLAAPIWEGLASKELSLDMLRKTFCRQLVKGNGFWWFDMWGGWYRDPDLMAELGRMRAVYAAAPAGNRAGVSEIAVFTDETANRDLTECGLRNLPFEQRRALGVMGAPYDSYDLRDFGAVCGRYRAVLFISAVPTEALRRAADDCRKNGIPCLSAAESLRTFTAAELRALCRAAGVHIWCETDDTVYVNENFIAVHAVTPGEKTLCLDRRRAYRELLAPEEFSGAADTIRLAMRANETRLFALD
jgi:beta-galactosidase